MCIRYAIGGERLTQWSERIGAWIPEEDWREGLDMFPGYEGPVLVPDWTTGERKVVRAKWGAQPFWAKDPKFGQKNAYNARDDSLGPTPRDTKPTWRESFFKRRCIVPADAFFERFEYPEDSEKRFVRFGAPGGEVLQIAGLFEESNKLSELPSFAMVTTEPNAVVVELHDRMPVVLSSEDAERWISQDADPRELLAMLRPAPDDALSSTRELLLSEHRAMTRAKRLEATSGQDGLL